MNIGLSSDQQKKYGQLVAKAWGDEGFKQKLVSDPAGVLAAAGICVPPGVDFRVVENTDQVVYLVLPPKPVAGELSDEQLDKAAGGGLKCACMLSW